MGADNNSRKLDENINNNNKSKNNFHQKMLAGQHNFRHSRQHSSPIVIGTDQYNTPDQYQNQNHYHIKNHPNNGLLVTLPVRDSADEIDQNNNPNISVITPLHHNGRSPFIRHGPTSHSIHSAPMHRTSTKLAGYNSYNPNNPSNLLTSHNVTNNNSRRPSNVPIPASNMMSHQITSANGRHSTMMPVESINDVGVGARNSNFGGHPASISKFGNSEINYIPNHSYNNNNNEAHAEIQDIYMREKSQESEKCLLCSKSMCVLMVVGVLILTGVII